MNYQSISHQSLILAALASLAVGQPMLAATDSWAIDSAHSDAHFSVKHMMISNVQGDFGKITGQATFDGQHFDKASVEATIPISQIDTREPKRDEHLKGPDFLNVEQFPTMTFKSKKVSVEGDSFKLVGDLTLHGVTKEVVLSGKIPEKPIKDPWGKIRFGAAATTRINRKDFKIDWNKSLDNGGVMISDEVDISIDVELVKQPT